MGCEKQRNKSRQTKEVVILIVKDGNFVTEGPALPACVSRGKTYATAVANIKDTIEAHLASLKKHGEPVPPPITEEIVEILA